MNLFTEPAERAKAMGIFGFVASGGGSIGVLLGGVLTDVLDWHWIFLVNIPIGVAVVAALAAAAAGRRAARTPARKLDVAGAVTVTAALMLAVYAIVNGNQEGWLSAADARAARASPWRCSALFLAIESRVSSPLMPLGLIRKRNVATANVVGVLWAAAMFAWFFLSALYLQLVLGYSPLKVGLAFLPGNIDHGHPLGRRLGQARDALRHQAAARRRPAASPRSGLLLARARAGARQLRRSTSSRA